MLLLWLSTLISELPMRVSIRWTPSGSALTSQVWLEEM